MCPVGGCIFTLEILEGDCFSTSILQGLGELHFTLIFIEIFKIRDSERCLYQNQNQVKNGHWNQDGNSIKFPHKFQNLALSVCWVMCHYLACYVFFSWEDFPWEQACSTSKIFDPKTSQALCISADIFLMLLFRKVWRVYDLQCQFYESETQNGINYRKKL